LDQTNQRSTEAGVARRRTEALHALLTAEQEILLFDVRPRLDVLANSEIILGATRIHPREPLENSLLIPKEKDSVVYCACPSDRARGIILRRAQSMPLLRMKFLERRTGGVESEGLSRSSDTKNPFTSTGETRSTSQRPTSSNRSWKYAFQLSGRALTREARCIELTSSLPYLFARYRRVTSETGTRFGSRATTAILSPAPTSPSWVTAK
jgi:hypothetical protein